MYVKDKFNAKESTHFRLLSMLESFRDNEQEWKNRMYVMKVVYDTLCEYQNKGWRPHISGSVVYKCAERDSDIDFCVELTGEDDTAETAYGNFDKKHFDAQIREHDHQEKLRVLRIHMIDVVSLVRCDISYVEGSSLRMIQIDISFGSKGYQIGYYLRQFADHTPFIFLTVFVKRLLTNYCRFGSQIEYINGVSLCMIVLRFLKDYYPDIKEQCEALVNYPAEEPSLEEIDNAYRPISEMLNYKPEYLPEMLKKFIAFFRDVIKNQYDIDIVSTNGHLQRSQSESALFVAGIPDENARKDNLAHRLSENNRKNLENFLDRILNCLQTNPNMLLKNWENEIIPKRDN